MSDLPGLPYLLVMVLVVVLADVESPKSQMNSTGLEFSLTTAKKDTSVLVG